MFGVVKRQCVLAEVAPVNPTKAIVHVRASIVLLTPVAACGTFELAVPFYKLFKIEFQRGQRETFHEMLFSAAFEVRFRRRQRAFIKSVPAQPADQIC